MTSPFTGGRVVHHNRGGSGRFPGSGTGNDAAIPAALRNRNLVGRLIRIGKARKRSAVERYLPLISDAITGGRIGQAECKDVFSFAPAYGRVTGSSAWIGRTCAGGTEKVGLVIDRDHRVDAIFDAVK